MQVTLKLFASLGDYLPQGASGNQARLTVEAGTTLMQLIEPLGMPAKAVHLVLLNGLYVEPAQRSTTVLRDEDVLAIWPPIAGG